MKTGYICNSGFNLVASATRNGRKLVAIVFGARSGRARADLAQLLLVDGFARARQGTPAKLTDLENRALGGVLPADMTASVCKKKPAVTLASTDQLKGWGLSFGSFETAQEANTVLRRRLLTPSGLGIAGTAGVMKLPGGLYGAMLWDAGQQPSVAACAAFRSEGAYCNVMMPESFAAIAALSPKQRPKVEKPRAQGSNATRSKVKMRVKRK